jgi:transposase
MPKRGPRCKLGYHRVFNLILWVLYTGMQWKCLPVPKDTHGNAAIHYTTVYKVFARWSDDGSLEDAFMASVGHLSDHNHLDLSVLHGDGTNTVAKRGGDGIGYSGYKHQKGEKVIAIIDNNGYVLAPLPGFVKLLRLRRSSDTRVRSPVLPRLLGRPLRARDLGPTLESIPHLVAVCRC